MSATYPPATATERRVSLSRGPALIVGTILLAAGLYFMYRQHTYPRWGNFPNGGAPVDRHVWGVFGVNGFTGLFTAVCGGLLLFGAAEHYMSKMMSLIVGAALGAAAIIGLVSGNVLGLAASNGWTELGWGIAALVLLINALIPAHRRTYTPARGRTVGAAGAGAAAGDMAARRRTRRAAVAEDPAYAGTGAAAGSGAAAGTGASIGRRSATGAGTATGSPETVPAEPGAATTAEPGAATTAEPGAATTAEPAAATTGEPGAATTGEPGPATTTAGAGAPAAPGRDVAYTHQMTGNPEANQQAAEPVTAGRGNPPREDQAAGTGNSGGGPLSRLFGRRN